MKSGWLVAVVSFLSLVACLAEWQDGDSPHPGHLLPFGCPSSGPRSPVFETSVFPSPASFVVDFVLASRPVLMKGVYKVAPAFELWDDEYFRTVYEPPESVVAVETKKKEDRTAEMIETSFKSFVATYRHRPVYMVHRVPQHLERDVSIPFSLQCPEFVRLFRQNVMWMSSGGTKSVVHIDDYENLNCLVRGEKELVLVDRSKYPKAVPLDRSAETFSSLDVDAVDYHKYPSMANVGEYHLANMTAGDCLYIPYKWIHQVRSYGRNIAVNLWWDQGGTKAMNLEKCERDSTSDPHLTLRSVDWDGPSNPEEEEEEEEESFRSTILAFAEEEDLTFQFIRSLFFDDNYTGKSLFADLAPSYEDRGVKWLLALFSRLDLDSDGLISSEELNSLTEDRWKEVERIEEDVSVWMDGVLRERNGRKDEL